VIIDKEQEIYITLKKTVNELTQTDTARQNSFWELDLYTGKLFWSDGICQLLGITKPYSPTLEQLIRYYQSEQNLRASFNRAIHQGIPFELDLPTLTASDKIIMVCTTANPVYDDYGKCIAIKGSLQTELQQQSDISKSDSFVSADAKEHDIMFENFARIVSHNLRSHTSNLQMILESINLKSSSKKMRDVIGSIKTISSNLNQTVGYLNTLIKI